MLCILVWGSLYSPNSNNVLSQAALVLSKHLVYVTRNKFASYRPRKHQQQSAKRYFVLQFIVLEQGKCFTSADTVAWSQTLCDRMSYLIAWGSLTIDHN